jgi:hypothetical protein
MPLVAVSTLNPTLAHRSAKFHNRRIVVGDQHPRRPSNQCRCICHLYIRSAASGRPSLVSMQNAMRPAPTRALSTTLKNDGPLKSFDSVADFIEAKCPPGPANSRAICKPATGCSAIEVAAPEAIYRKIPWEVATKLKGFVASCSVPCSTFGLYFLNDVLRGLCHMTNNVRMVAKILPS